MDLVENSISPKSKDMWGIRPSRKETGCNYPNDKKKRKKKEACDEVLGSKWEN